MAEISKGLKDIWLKSMQAISSTASTIASNTKYKVDEMNILNRRRDILSDFGARAYELWQKGEVFPAPLNEQLEELSKLDESLNAIRTEKLAGVKTDAPEEKPAVEQPAEADESAEKASDEEKEKTSMSAKFDSAVETVSKTFGMIGSKIESGIEALSKAMKAKTEDSPVADKEAPAIEVVEDAVDAVEEAAEDVVDAVEEIVEAPVLVVEEVAEEAPVLVVDEAPVAPEASIDAPEAEAVDAPVIDVQDE